jgi:acyl dehydratase
LADVIAVIRDIAIIIVALLDIVILGTLAVLAFMGFEWNALLPVRVGDTIFSRSRTATKRSMREGGVVIEEREVINQRGEIVHKGKFTFLVAKKPA